MENNKIISQPGMGKSLGLFFTVYRKTPIVTINVPLFKKLRDIIFFLRDNHFMSHFKGHFEVASTFLTTKFKGSKKSRPPQNVP